MTLRNVEKVIAPTKQTRNRRTAVASTGSRHHRLREVGIYLSKVGKSMGSLCYTGGFKGHPVCQSNHDVLLRRRGTVESRMSAIITQSGSSRGAVGGVQSAERCEMFRGHSDPRDKIDGQPTNTIRRRQEWRTNKTEATFLTVSYDPLPGFSR